MPLYGRYMVDRIPGLSWVSDFSVTLLIHYWAAAVLMGAVAFHLVFHLIRRTSASCRGGRPAGIGTDYHGHLRFR
jgi:hypothetical protein